MEIIDLTNEIAEAVSVSKAQQYIQLTIAKDEFRDAILAETDKLMETVIEYAATFQPTGLHILSLAATMLPPEGNIPCGNNDEEQWDDFVWDITQNHIDDVVKVIDYNLPEESKEWVKLNDEAIQKQVNYLAGREEDLLLPGIEFNTPIKAWVPRLNKQYPTPSRSLAAQYQDAAKKELLHRRLVTPLEPVDTLFRNKFPEKKRLTLTPCKRPISGLSTTLAAASSSAGKDRVRTPLVKNSSFPEGHMFNPIIID